MLPKPFPAIETKRLPKRKPVTFALGFNSIPAVVLCSDTQMTSDSGFKFEESKMLCASSYEMWKLTWGIFGTYAGSPAKAKAVERQLYELLNKSYKEPSWEQFERALQKVLTNVCKKHRGPLQMLWAFSTKRDVRLVRADQKTITDVFDYECLGLGDSSLARFLLKTLYTRNKTQNAIRVAAYVVSEAMKYVEGVGGSIEVSIVYKNGGCRLMRVKNTPTARLALSKIPSNKLFEK